MGGDAPLWRLDPRRSMSYRGQKPGTPNSSAKGREQQRKRQVSLKALSRVDAASVIRLSRQEEGGFSCSRERGVWSPTTVGFRDLPNDDSRRRNRMPQRRRSFCLSRPWFRITFRPRVPEALR